MAFGDNFMWDPDQAIQGETTDVYFNWLGAFEIISFNLGMAPEGATPEVSSGGAGAGAEGGSGGGANAGKQGRSTTGMNAGLLSGVKLGGTVAKRLGGGGGSSTSPTQFSSGGTGGGSGSRGKPKFGTLTINKWVDNASVDLYHYCSMGTIIPTLNIAVRKSGGSNLLYVQYCFRYNQITGIAWQGGDGDHGPAETFTVEFKALGMQYIRQAATGQDPDAPKPWLWSVETIDPTGESQMTLAIDGVSPKEPVFVAGVVDSKGNFVR
jgi:type VI protein secretion system component Hcp